jgi:membrane protease YdiL (CAAX protease family)
MASTQQADRQRDPRPRTGWRTRARAIAIGLGLVIAALVIGTVLSIGPILAGGTSLVALTAVFVLSEAGYAIAGWVYVHQWFSEGVPIEIPTRQQFGWVIASTLVMLGIATGIGVISSRTGIQIGRADQELLTGNPTMVLVLAVLSFVLIAPAEEYLFRGVIQRRLTRSMRTSAAIGVASLLFVIPHAIGYLGGIGGILLLSLAPFSLAVILGALYEKCNNLSVPILAHGFYNATLFVITYVTAF